MITVNELLLGKETVIKGKEYFSTAKYVQPFLDRMKEFTSEFKVYVKTPDQMTGRIDNPDVTYNKVLVQAILPTKVGDYNETICFCYALDVRKPVAKFFKCYMNVETGIILAFNPSWQSTQAIEAEEPLSYADVKKLLELTDDVAVKVDQLEDKPVDRGQLNSILGSWVRRSRMFESNSEFGKVKLSSTNAIDAFEMIFENQDSDYYCDKSTAVSMFDCYEAFGQTIADDKKDIINKFDKALLVNTIMGV